jgi:hypothetical protein
MKTSFLVKKNRKTISAANKLKNASPIRCGTDICLTGKQLLATTR